LTSEKIFILEPGGCRAFFAAKKANAVVILTLLGTAQPISMQLNDLSLKPRDTFEQSRFIPSRRPLHIEIFCNLVQRPEDFNPAFFHPFCAPYGLARNQAVTRATGSCIFAPAKLILSIIHEAS